MRKFFVILLALQLIVSPIAFADPQKPSLPAGPTVDAHYTTGLGSVGGFDFYSKQILALGMGIVGSNIMIQCPKILMTPSGATYFASSVTYIASEFLAALETNARQLKTLHDIAVMEDTLAKEGTQIQKAALEEQLNDEKEHLSYIVRKGLWMSAVTAGFSASAALAIAEEIYGQAQGYSSSASICTSECSNPIAATGCHAECYALSPLGALAAGTVFSWSADAAEKGADACSKTGHFSAACEAHLAQYLSAVWTVCQPVTLGAGEIVDMALSTAIMGAWGFLTTATSGVQGGGISMYGQLMAAALNVAVPSISKALVATMSFPIPRSIVFGSNAALGTAITGGLTVRGVVAAQNIEKLTRVLRQFSITNNGKGNLEENLDGAANDPNEARKGKIAKLAKGLKDMKTCLGEDRTSSPNNCRSPFKVKRSELNLGIDLAFLHSASHMTTDMANLAAAGEWAQVDAIAAKLAAMRDHIHEIEKKLRKKLNDDLVSKGRDPVDFDGRIKDQLASWQAMVNQAAKDKGVTVPTSQERLSNAALSKNISASSATGRLGSPARPSFANKSYGPIVDLSPDPVEITGKKWVEAGEGIEEFETREVDINKDTGMPIWLQLSNRYFLSYPKLYEFKKKGAPKK